MKILILGANGNLGNQLSKIFNTSQNKVICLDKKAVDITDKHQISKKIKEIKPNIVINATAYNAVDLCEKDEKQFKFAQILNGDAVGFLAKACLENNITLIHYSSDYVFDGKSRKGYTELDKPNPINNYGKTKAMGEKEIARYALLGLKWYLIRTSKLFGPKGESAVAKPSFFDTMLRLAKEKKELDVVNEEKSCFTYTKDLAEATKKLIDDKKDYGTYHIVNSESATWYEATKTLFDIANINIKITPVSSDKFPRPAKRPEYSTLKSIKLTPLRNYKDALKNYLKK